MGLVREEELELGAGSLGLGFDTASGDDSNSSSLQLLQWQQNGGDGSLLSSSSRVRPEQGVTDGNGGIRGGFVSSNGLVISSWYTPDQWRELQRQAMIYKHIAASVPIPADLLWGLWPPSPSMVDCPQIPATTTTAAALCSNRTGSPGIHGGQVNQHLLAGAAADPEPRRCRRTDGKKWRCANESADGKRYCDKHLHRSRPRSRKPVERQQSQTQPQQLVPPPHAGTATTKQDYSQLLQVVDRKPFFPPPPPPVEDKNEISSWNMDCKKVKSEETVSSVSCTKARSEEMMQHLGHSKLESEQQWRPQQQQTLPLVHLQLQQQQQDEKPPQAQQQQYHHQPPDQNYYPYGSAYHQDDSFFSLLNSDINSLNERHLSFGADPWSSSTAGTTSLAPAPEPYNYIDFARSNDNNNNNSVSPTAATPQPPPPPLSLVPAASAEETKPPPFWWLADALLTAPSSDLQPLGAAASAPHPTTDEEGGGGGVAAVSSPLDSSAAASPSGVLQRPLASISDCSSNNSSSEAFGGLGGGGGGGAETTTPGLHTWMIMKP